MIGTLQLSLTKDQIEIIKAVLYFDVFKYPLTKDELYENSAISVSKEQFDLELNGLLKHAILKQDGKFVLSLERIRDDLTKRINGNESAKKIMPKALKYSRIIAAFPFVEGVCLSGGLSKNYFDKKGDIDFFIITKPNRLWICRSLLIAVYKLLPTHLKRYWCTNYFISSDNLSIPDTNVFTGTELAYLIPTVNYPIYKKVIEQNNWYKTNFPNKHIASPDNCTNPGNTILKSILETLLSGPFGNWLDDMLLKTTLRRWRKKYPEMTNEDFDLQFRSRKDVCKRHTHGFQNKVLMLWQNKKHEFEKQFNAKLG